jgi:chromosome segregation ATPase
MIAKFSSTWPRGLAAGRSRCVPLLVFLSIFHPLHAAEEADPSVKLREQLRSVLLQLRSAQTESANAQATAAAAEVKNQELTGQIANLEKRIETLGKQINDDKVSAEESIATLNNKLLASEKRIVEFTEALAKWKEGYQKAAAVARTKEEERAALAAEVIVHQRTIADRERKNIALFNTSNEVLDRFESYALGKALSAREPFIGTTRVKVENLVQGYQDKILDNRISAPVAKP